jgi:uncharacterized membrane protein YuzA (DUF378 family)
LNDLNVYSLAAVVGPRNADALEDTSMKGLGLIALLLVVVGAINWGLVGLAQFDLVATLFGGQSAVISRVVYSLVGLAGITLLALQFRGSPAPQRA